jgi:hypothetical protein
VIAVTPRDGLDLDVPMEFALNLAYTVVAQLPMCVTAPVPAMLALPAK